MDRPIDLKYEIHEGRIRKQGGKNEIPVGEPLFFLEGRMYWLPSFLNTMRTLFSKPPIMSSWHLPSGDRPAVCVTGTVGSYRTNLRGANHGPEYRPEAYPGEAWCPYHDAEHTEDGCPRCIEVSEGIIFVETESDLLSN